MELRQSEKLAGVCYDVRGPVVEAAARMEAAGERVLKLNIGNPAPFGFTTPPEVLAGVAARLDASQGYSDSRGLPGTREAVARYHAERGVPVRPDDIYLGNGVSELIMMSLQALLNDGDEILIPTPDYPLWTAVVRLCGGTPVHYVCDEASDWLPDLTDLAYKVTDRTRAVVVINPNNPTGAVYPRDVLEGVVALARRAELMIFADEIYDRILYDDAVHVPLASLAPDLLCATFNGLSKSYRLAGFRAGWMALSGPRTGAESYLEGLNILANMRLCANVPGQVAIEAALAQGGGAGALVLPGGRLLEQRDLVHQMLTAIPGVSCVKPRGALYAFPRIDPAVYPIDDDERFVLDLLRSERILLVPGGGFNWPRPDHVRIVTLPPVEDLKIALDAFGSFLARYPLP